MSRSLPAARRIVAWRAAVLSSMAMMVLPSLFTSIYAFSASRFRRAPLYCRDGCQRRGKTDTTITAEILVEVSFVFADATQLEFDQSRTSELLTV